MEQADDMLAVVVRHRDEFTEDPEFFFLQVLIVRAIVPPWVSHSGSRLREATAPLG